MSKKNIIITLLMLPLSAALLHPQGIDRDVVIEIKASEGAEYYIIEWLEERPSDESSTGSSTEKVFTTVIERNVAGRYRYFRVKSCRGEDRCGDWGRVYKIPMPELPDEPEYAEEDINNELFTVSTTSEGRRLFLNKNPADLSKLTTEQPFYYSVNDSEKKIYTSPVSFNKPGSYNLKLYRENSDRPFKELSFIVDNRAPSSRAILRPPFYVYDSVVWLSPGGTVEIITRDNHDKNVKTYYRAYSDPYNKGSYRVYRGRLKGAELERLHEGKIMVEYYSRDASGNRERPKTITSALDTRAPRIKYNTEQSDNNRLIFDIDEISFPVIVRVNGSDETYRVRNRLVLKNTSLNNLRLQLTDYAGNIRIWQSE